MALDIVESIQDSIVKIQCFSKDLKIGLRKLGASRSFLNFTKWKIPYRNEEELAKILIQLRDLGFLMGGDSSGWPPAEVFKHLRSKNLIDGNFKEILWRSKNNHEIFDQ